MKTNKNNKIPLPKRGVKFRHPIYKALMDLKIGESLTIDWIKDIQGPLKTTKEKKWNYRIMRPKGLESKRLYLQQVLWYLKQKRIERGQYFFTLRTIDENTFIIYRIRKK